MQMPLRPALQTLALTPSALTLRKVWRSMMLQLVMYAEEFDRRVARADGVVLYQLMRHELEGASS